MIHLLAPGLLGPAPPAEDGAALPRLSHLETLLGRGDRLPAPGGYAETVFALFGLNGAPGADTPTAPLCLAHDRGTLPTGWVAHADPVHLRADQDRLILFDGRDVAPDRDEAGALVAAFNRHFGADHIELLVTDQGRWYLLADRAPGVRTTPLAEVSGRDIYRYLPTGERQRDWRRLLNEVQMLFHDLAPNQAREAAGRLPLNGLWFSGGGRMPAPGSTTIGRVVGTDRLVAAAAAHAAVHGEDELWVESAALEAVLAADHAAWVDALRALDRRVGGCLEKRLECRVYPADGVVWQWRPAMRRRLWRRAGPIARWLRSS